MAAELRPVRIYAVFHHRIRNPRLKVSDVRLDRRYGVGYCECSDS